MARARLAALCFAVLSLVSAAGAASAAAPTAPTGLHGFLLRADEPAHDSFPRTPSFAWNPVPGASGYEFQLSTSSTFSADGNVWSTSDLTTPVAAPSMTLPWISGSPHALFARVRATLSANASTPWSRPYGFDMTPPPPPKPLPAAPGLLRWTPVEGASGYEIWFIDDPNQKKTEQRPIIRTNVVDEREFYTFHQSTKWTATVRWRVRALRDDVKGRFNGIPAIEYGAWSPVYTSTNPPVQGGPITLDGTMSDVTGDGSATAPAHRLMPGFLFHGNQTEDGSTTELYRVYIFTDKQCLNRVFTGTVVGSPAYAPRAYNGPLSLPLGDTSVARESYLPTGGQLPALTADGETVTPTEAEYDEPPAPTQTLPTVDNNGVSSFISWGDSLFGGAYGAPDWLVDAGKWPGAPVDLWDTDWPQSGYYWTVVGVEGVPPSSISTSVASPGAQAQDTVLPVSAGGGFNNGDTILVGYKGINQEAVTIANVSATSFQLVGALKSAHGPGEPIVRTTGNLEYVDTESAQDVCADGRVARFGLNSEPTLAASGDAFASGLSSTGRLTSATHTNQFYGYPVVSWTPALGASVYQVEWSRTAYPFIPEANPDPQHKGAQGLMSAATSAILPVGPGTWWYRVRGFDYQLPSETLSQGASATDKSQVQAMSWSDPAKIEVAAPKFVVVGGQSAGSTKAKAKAKTRAQKSRTSSSTRRWSGAGFSLAAPKTWTRLQTRDTVALLAIGAPKSGGFRTNANVLAAGGRDGRSYDRWAQDLATEVKVIASGPVASRVVSEPAGEAVWLQFPFEAGGKTLSSEEFVFDAKGSSYVVTFTTLASLQKRYAPIFARAAASFRLR